jgi:hypothetical protein
MRPITIAVPVLSRVLIPVFVVSVLAAMSMLAALVTVADFYDVGRSR